MPAIQFLPPPPAPSTRWHSATFVDDHLVALCESARVVFDDALGTVSTELWPLPMGHRRLTHRGVVVGEPRANDGRGSLVFSDPGGKEQLVNGIAPPTATWLGESIDVEGQTVVARCRANRYNKGSEDWLAVFRPSATGWELEATWSDNWLYSFSVADDTLVTVSANGVRWYRRHGSQWASDGALPLSCGAADTAALADRVAVARLVEVFIYERRLEGWAETACLPIGRPGTYPNYDLALHGERLAIGSSERSGKAQGQVRIYRRAATGTWYEELRVADKGYGDLALNGRYLVYMQNTGMVRVDLDALRDETCREVAPKKAPTSFRSLWIGPEEKKKRPFLARLDDGRLGLCVKVGARWEWMEGGAELVGQLPGEWQDDARAALTVGSGAKAPVEATRSVVAGASPSAGVMHTPPHAATS